MMMVWLLATFLMQPLIPVAPFVTPPPVVDGNPDEPAWTKVHALALTHRLGNGSPSVSTTVRMCFSDLHLFVLFVCDEPNIDKIRGNIRKPDGEVWTDDSVEVFLAPDPAEPSAYYHILVNTLGVVRDEFWRGVKDDVDWNSEARVAVRKNGQQWVAEVAIPLRRLNRMPMLSDVWLVNFTRNRYATGMPEFLTWQPCRQSFHEPERFGKVTLQGLTGLPLVQRLSEEIVQREVSALQEQFRRWRRELPAQPRTSLGKQVVALLTEWQKRLSGKADVATCWQQVRMARREGADWGEWVMRAKVAERLQRPYAVFAVSPMLKLRPEELPDAKPDSEIFLHAARGEGESAQLLVAALERPLENVKVSVTPLVGPKGALVLPEVRLVGYVPVQKPTPGGFGIAGRYPDPLLPLRPFDVPQGEQRALWLTVWVPREAEAGDYDGAIIVEPQNVPKMTVKVRLRIYPVVLPAQSFLKTCVLIWDYKARQVYGEAWTPERNRRFYELCLRYRFTPPPPLAWDKIFVRQPDGTWTANWDEFDKEVEAWRQKGATAFSIGGILHWGTKPPPPEQQHEVATKLRLLDEHLTAKGWSERFYFYVFDEPGTAEFDNIQTLCAFVKQHAPNLQVLLTAGYGATGPFRTHAPTPEGAAYRTLANFIRIWVPHIDCFDEEFLRERKKAGNQVWMYVCISTVGKTYPDIWRIDWTGTAHRAVGWWLFRYGCDGFLYWCVNYWTDDKGKPFDLFANPVAFPGGNGDGFLFYPNPEGGDPLPSVRAEIFRDAIEDYDLLTLLRQRNSQSPLLRAEDIIPAPNKFADDPQIYEKRHRALLEALSKGTGR